MEIMDELEIEVMHAIARTIEKLEKEYDIDNNRIPILVLTDELERISIKLGENKFKLAEVLKKLKTQDKYYETDVAHLVVKHLHTVGCIAKSPEHPGHPEYLQKLVDDNKQSLLQKHKYQENRILEQIEKMEKSNNF